MRRELCAVVTKGEECHERLTSVVCHFDVTGTRTYGVLDGNCSNSAGSYLMALTEKVLINYNLIKCCGNSKVVDTLQIY